MRSKTKAIALVLLAGDAGQRFRPALEFAVVSAIVCVVAALSLLQFNAFILQSKVTEGLTLAVSPRVASSLHFAENGTWPETLEAGAIQNDVSGRSVAGYRQHADGAVTMVMDAEALEDPTVGSQLTLRPAYMLDAPPATVVWVCGYAEPPPGLVATSNNRTDLTAAATPSPCKLRKP